MDLSQLKDKLSSDDYELLKASEFSFFSFTQLKSGAALLFEKAGFLWGGLPYPKMHALLALILFQTQKGQQMLNFQKAFLDHNKEPIYSLFQQHHSFERYPWIYELLFEKTAFRFEEKFFLLDEELGFISKRDAHFTLALLGSGCRSGMGAFLYKDVGVINFGPQTSPIGDCEEFGLSLKPQNFNFSGTQESFSLSYQNRVPTSQSRSTDLTWLADTGYSRAWFSTKQEFSNLSLRIECAVTSLLLDPPSHFFSFFCRSMECIVAKGHKLKPRSLDRYIGPVQELQLKGGQGSLRIRCDDKNSKMEVIPLAGDMSFWGASFLVVFAMEGGNGQYIIEPV